MAWRELKTTYQARMTKGKRDFGKDVQRGFTLLEMVIVLSIIAAIVSLVVLDFRNVATEQRLRESSGDIESFAKRARNIAVVQQRVYELTISEFEIRLAPQYERAEDDDTLGEGDELEVRRKFEDIIDTEETDAEVTYEIRRWGSDEWQTLEDEKKVVLAIDPTGLVEPISIRCSIGESWIMQELHPLTAGVSYEEMSIEGE